MAEGGYGRIAVRPRARAIGPEPLPLLSLERRPASFLHSTTTWEPARLRTLACARHVLGASSEHPLRAMRENTPHPASVHTQAAIGRNNPSATRGPKGRGSLDRTATNPPHISLTQW